MYETIQVGDWVVKADVEETRKQYEKEIDMCECLLCQNYREVMKTLPPDKVRIFEDLGLQPTVCPDINEFGLEGDRHLYVASYLLLDVL
ncbi:hypothetical protein ACHADS_07210 [Bacillus vallismortis]|uniref:hypothetical protein n=1 Tax=Bacillus vallismortis TaxID=72361 RepID=UPI00374CF765